VASVSRRRVATSGRSDEASRGQHARVGDARHGPLGCTARDPLVPIAGPGLPTSGGSPASPPGSTVPPAFLAATVGRTLTSVPFLVSRSRPTLRLVGLELILGIVLGLMAVWLIFIGLLWLLRPRDASLGELLRVVPDIVRLVRRLLGDQATPLGVRAALVFLAIWLVNPIDLIPEFVPVLGPLDDVVVAVLVLRYVRRRMGLAQLRESWPGTDAGFELLSSVVGGGSARPA